MLTSTLNISGQQLKRILQVNGFSAETAAAGMELSSRAVYDWYRKPVVKKILIERIITLLKIDRKQFYPDTENIEVETERVHHGTIVKVTMTEKGITAAALARKLKVARQTIHNWFNEQIWPDGRLFEAAKVLGVPVALLKGRGEGKVNFEKDIYDKLHSIETLLLDISNRIDK